LSWDDIAEEFDKKVGPEGEVDPFRRDCVDNMLLTSMSNICRSGDSVLDAGSGNGYFVKKLEKAGYRTAGLDISPALLKIARERCPYNTFHEADLENRSSCPSRSWDAIICSFVLDGLRDLGSGLSSLNSLLRVGGCLIVNIPHPAFIVGDSRGGDRRKLYFEDDPHGEDYFLFGCTKPVQYYWRPVSRYLNAIIAAKFEITHLIEPDPVPLDKYFRASNREPMHAYVLGIVARRSN
jgi:SAM-dependent methyltransferase